MISQMSPLSRQRFLTSWFFKFVDEPGSRQDVCIGNADGSFRLVFFWLMLFVCSSAFFGNGMSGALTKKEWRWNLQNLGI